MNQKKESKYQKIKQEALTLLANEQLDSYKQALIYVAMERYNLNFTECSKMFNKNPGTIYNLITRAKRRLQKNE